MKSAKIISPVAAEQTNKSRRIRKSHESGRGTYACDEKRRRRLDLGDGRALYREGGKSQDHDGEHPAHNSEGGGEPMDPGDGVPHFWRVPGSSHHVILCWCFPEAPWFDVAGREKMVFEI